MSVTVTSKRYHKVKKERDESHNKVEELTKELEQWQEKYENMEQERDAARKRQHELTKDLAGLQFKYDAMETELQAASKRHPSIDEELRRLKGLSEKETPLEAGSYKEEAAKTTPWLEGWKVKQLASLSMECLHQGQRVHDIRGSKVSLGGLKTKPLEITIVNLSKVTKLEMAANFFHSGKFSSQPIGAIAPGESHTYGVSSRDGTSKTGVKGGLAFAVSNVEGVEMEPDQLEEETPKEEITAGDEEKDIAEEKEEDNTEETKNVENGEAIKENKEVDEDKELEKFDEPNGEKKDEKKKKRFSLKREKKHKETKDAAPAEEQGEPAADTAEDKPEEPAPEEAKEEETKEEEAEVETSGEVEAAAETTDEADSAEKKPKKEKKKGKFSLRKHKKNKDNKVTEQETIEEETTPEAQDEADNKEPAEATEEQEAENEAEPEQQTEEKEEEEIEGTHEETPEVVGNGSFFVVAFENPLAGIQKAKSSKTQAKDILPVMKKMKSGSPSKQPYGGHYKDGKRHFVYIWKDPELGW